MKNPLITKVASPKILEQSYRHVCNSRIKSGYNNSIWDLRFNWERAKRQLIQKLRANDYHFSPLHRYFIDGQSFECWEAADAVVLKAISIVLTKKLMPNIPRCCTHIKGHGGSKKAVRAVKNRLDDYKFIFKSDIQSYYQRINHYILLRKLKEKISDSIVLRLIKEYAQRLVWNHGEYETITKGIPQGCSLSPLFSAWFLKELDQALVKLKVFYLRFSDDWLILAKTRNELRKAIKITERILKKLRLKKHPDKTYIGWIKKGFDFLGYHLTPELLAVGTKTQERYLAKISQLYEQGASIKRIGQYWLNWLRWASGGLEVCRVFFQVPITGRVDGPPSMCGGHACWHPV